MFDLALAIFLLLSPIILLPTIGNLSALQFYQFGVISSNSMLQLQFFQFGTVALFIVSLFQKKIREYKDFWLSLFLIACLVSVFLNPESITMSVNIFLGFLLYKLVVENTKNIKFVLIPVVIVGVLNSIFAILQSFGVHFIYNDMGRIFGLMRLESHLGTYQALSMPILAVFNPLWVVIPLIGLLLSKTWTALAGVVIVIMYLLRKKARVLGSVGMMFLMSLFVLFIIRYRSNIMLDLYPRLWVWKEIIKDLTFTGTGFCEFTKVYPFVKNFHNAVHINETFNSTYNIYLYIIHSLGILSIPIFIWIGEQFKFRNQDRLSRCLFASCLTLLIIGLGQSFMEFPRLAGTAIVIFGLLKIKQGGEYDSVKV